MFAIYDEAEYITRFNLVIWAVLFFLLVSSIIKGLDRRFPLATFEPYLLIITSVLYFGFRNDSIGVDTGTYHSIFNSYAEAKITDVKYDLLFNYPLYFLAKWRFDFSIVLFICAVLYIVSIYCAARKISKRNALLFLLVFFVSPNFFQFGINVMRNGVAASLFILGLACLYEGEKRKGCTIMICAAGVHASMLLPLAVFIVSKHIKASKALLIVWLFCVIAILSGVLSIRNIPRFLLFSERMRLLWIISPQKVPTGSGRF